MRENNVFRRTIEGDLILPNLDPINPFRGQYLCESIASGCDKD